MAFDFFQVTASGRIGNDPEVKKVGEHDLLVFSFASSLYAGKDKEQTNWVTVNAWGPKSKVGQFLRKGMKIVVNGRLRIKTTKKDDGTYSTYVNLDANDIVIPDKGRNGGPQGSGSSVPGYGGSAKPAAPAGQPQQGLSF